MNETKIIKGMTGTIMNYRRGKHITHPRHILIQFDGYENDKKAAVLIGREVAWETRSGKLMRGKIVATHGRNGVVRAIFQKGLPGEALGTKLKIIK
ncbi:MAG: 50S ribosomal protein L35ae [Candidatus Helarchaeota archaeon]